MHRSSSSQPRVNEASMPREELCMDCEPRESPRIFVDNEKQFEGTPQDIQIRKPMDAKRKLSAQPKFSERTLEGEQVRGRVKWRDRAMEVPPAQRREPEREMTACDLGLGLGKGVGIGVKGSTSERGDATTYAEDTNHLTEIPAAAEDSGLLAPALAYPAQQLEVRDCLEMEQMIGDEQETRDMAMEVLPAQPEVWDCPELTEQAIGEEQQREMVYSSSPSRPAYCEVSTNTVPISWCDVENLPLLRPSPGHKESKHSDANTTTAELSKRYEALSREHQTVRGELQAKLQCLEEKDSRIASLKTDIAALQCRHEEQSTALKFARHELGSYQSQLDNVQRFISTADTHADQDIIQKLQELNEAVYQMSMTMADYATESFTRQSATARRAKEHTFVGENVLPTVGQVMVDHLAAVEGNEDIALFLQIAFHGYLSHLLCHITSLWTVDPRLNMLIEGTYQRLWKAETQAISGRWRSLTRTHILPSAVSDPKALVEYTMTGLSNIVTAAGLVSQPDTASKLSSKFGGKILTIVSHAGKFGDMVSGMISGDFEVFAIQPGATFDGASMVAMSEDRATPRGTGAAQTVLCVFRVGLRKRMGGETIVLIKAGVVLKSFLARVQASEV